MAALPSHHRLPNRLDLQPHPVGSHPPTKPDRKRSPRPSSSLPRPPPPAPKSSGRRRPAPRPQASKPGPESPSSSPQKDSSSARAMEQARILKRREVLKPEPAILPIRRARLAGSGSTSAYAGPTFSAAAPSPSSLPFPSFCLKKKTCSGAAKGDEATTTSLPILLVPAV